MGGKDCCRDAAVRLELKLNRKSALIVTLCCFTLFFVHQYIHFRNSGDWGWITMGSFLFEIPETHKDGMGKLIDALIWVWNKAWLGFYFLGHGLWWAFTTKEADNKFVWDSFWKE